MAKRGDILPSWDDQLLVTPVHDEKAGEAHSSVTVTPPHTAS